MNVQSQLKPLNGTTNWQLYKQPLGRIKLRPNTTNLATKGAVPLKIGRGKSIGHFGEILQGVYEDGDGHLHRMLYSLSCSKFHSTATFTQDNTGKVKILPTDKIKTCKAVEILRKHLKKPISGQLTIEDNIPIGGGCGSSTSNIIAGIRAICDCFGVSLTPEIIAKLVVKAEQAADAIMHDNNVLFAHREGQVVETFDHPLPPMKVLGFNTDPKGIDTLNLKRARYNSKEIETFRVLSAALRRAIKKQDPVLVGRVATASATINQRFLPKPHFNSVQKIAIEFNALGIVISHSGTVMGLLFHPDTPNQTISKVEAILEKYGFTSTWCFST